MIDSLKRLLWEGESLLSVIKQDLPELHEKWIAEFGTFEEAINDVKEDLEGGVVIEHHTSAAEAPEGD